MPSQQREPNQLLSSNTDPFNRFVLFTNERQIAILFKDKESIPFAVQKSGATGDIEIEYRNHCMAMAMLEHRVPDIWGLEVLKNKASFYLEYIPEVLLSNVVAESFFNKKKEFIKEALQILDFYLGVFQDFSINHKAKPSVVNKNEIVEMSFEILSHPLASMDKTMLKQMFSETENFKVSYMRQHGDFCLRNILFGHKNRKVLIDWEDMDECAFPLMDYVMLFISLQELFSVLFKCKPKDMFEVIELKKKMHNVKGTIQSVLNLNDDKFKTLAFLSTVSLYRQNLRKTRTATAQLIFNELEKQVLNASDIVI